VRVRERERERDRVRENRLNTQKPSKAISHLLCAADNCFLLFLHTAGGGGGETACRELEGSVRRKAAEICAIVPEV